jgi:hypothetical protein
MKLKTSIILCILSFALAYSVDARTVDFDQDETIQSPADSADITLAGKWFIRSSDNRFEKMTSEGRFKLYPNQDDRTEAIIDDQEDVFDSLDTYIKEGIQSGFFTVQGDGLDLEAVASISYDAVCIENGAFCKFFVRYENDQHVLTLFEDQDDETAAATAARVSALTKLSNISTASNDGDFWIRK